MEKKSVFTHPLTVEYVMYLLFVFVTFISKYHAVL